MKRSRLFEVQMAMGATCVAVDGWEVIAGYGAPETEYAAARWSSAMFDLSFRCKLRVTGADRRVFLDRCLTRNTVELPVGQGVSAAALRRDGRMLAEMKVYALEEYLLLELAFEACHRMADHLIQSRTVEDIAVQDLTETWGLLSLQGPESVEALRNLGIRAPGEGAIASAILAGYPVLLAGNRRALAPGYDIFMAAGALVECWNSLMERGVRPAGMEVLSVLRLEAGLPWFGIDLDESVTPLEAGLEDVIDDAKEDYPGREAIERIRRRGGPPQRFCGILMPDHRVPRAGAPVSAKNRRVGRITSAAVSPATDRGIALAFLKRGHTAPGLQVEVIVGEDAVPARVARLPFTPAPQR